MNIGLELKRLGPFCWVIPVGPSPTIDIIEEDELITDPSALRVST